MSARRAAQRSASSTSNLQQSESDSDSSDEDVWAHTKPSPRGSESAHPVLVQRESPVAEGRGYVARRRSKTLTKSVEKGHLVSEQAAADYGQQQYEVRCASISTPPVPAEFGVSCGDLAVGRLWHRVGCGLSFTTSTRKETV
eukprot:SAG11_NODE_2228_length_3654_cov_1.962640_3_plen_142_part_00